jgi:hypothetical protein
MHMKKHEKMWFDRIMKYRASGKALTAFCAENDLASEQMKYWMYKRKIEKMPTADKTSRNKRGFVSYSLADGSQNGSGIKLELKGMTITVEKGFDKALLLEVTEALTA